MSHEPETQSHEQSHAHAHEPSQSHSHSHSHSHTHALSSNLLTAFLLNLAFTGIEIAGGLWTNSIAILSDALHDAGDSLTLALALYLQRLSVKSADARFTYGYRRFSSLGALISGVLLSVGVGYMGWQAVHRLSNPEPVHAQGMMMLAVIGVLFNGAAAWKLRHSHSLNEKVAGWHLVEDTLGWIAVLIGSAIMTVWDVPIIDPLLSLAISVFILWNVIRNLRQVAMVFLQRAPAGFDVAAFERRLCEFPGVLNAHLTQTWTVDGEHHVLSTHLVMQPGTTREEIVEAKRHVHRLLREQDFEHITVDVELEGEDCSAE
ncbi:cation diffusion facilitator family transporter [Roseimicrobium sp. ORNL1]|uniref:cation diffusion facilitator family transporter n=1 Tax=Roseimicrobium sp. ORNL1 TaxID=2711231 RepID=UPI0013E198DA|nr:cation diffusion facilitator family transporter [Roseimicrobium sp. ORNL1]QIF02034.1 cation transporter [Roseimicrobium sp. ORNL1]